MVFSPILLGIKEQKRKKLVRVPLILSYYIVSGCSCAHRYGIHRRLPLFHHHRSDRLPQTTPESSKPESTNTEAYLFTFRVELEGDSLAFQSKSVPHSHSGTDAIFLVFLRGFEDITNFAVIQIHTILLFRFVPLV